MTAVKNNMKIHFSVFYLLLLLTCLSFICCDDQNAELKTKGKKNKPTGLKKAKSGKDKKKSQKKKKSSDKLANVQENTNGDGNKDPKNDDQNNDGIEGLSTSPSSKDSQKDNDDLEKNKSATQKETINKSNSEANLAGELLKDFNQFLENLLENPQFLEDLEGKDPYSQLEQQKDNVDQNASIHDLTSYQNENTVQLIENEPKNIMTQRALIELTPDIFEKKFVLLEVSKYTRLKLSILNNEKQPIAQLGTIDAYDNKILIHKVILMRYKNNFLEIKQEFLQFKIELTYSLLDSIKLNFNESVKINTQLSPIINLVVNNEKLDDKDKKNQNNRIQFILKSDINEEELQGNENLNFFINVNNTKFPSQQQKDLTCSGFVNNGLIKTINTKSQFYCLQKDDCEYKISIKVQGLSRISFLPSIFPNQSIISFKSNLKGIEEIEGDEEVKYTFSVPKITDSWVFSVSPIYGKLDSQLQPDKLSENNDYLFKSSGKGIQKIIITQKEIQDNQWSGLVYQVSFKCLDQTCVFNFGFNMVQNKMIELLPTDQIEGKIIANEYTNFYIDFNQGSFDSIENNINIESKKQIKMVVRECESMELLQSNGCQIKGDNYQEFEKNTFVQHIRDNIWKFEVNCLGQNPFTQYEEFNKDWVVSDRCLFVIALQSQDLQEVNFKLNTKGFRTRKILDFGTDKHIQMFSDDQKKYQINVNVEYEWQKFIIIRFATIEGKMKVYYTIKQDQKITSLKDFVIDNTNQESVQVQIQNEYIKIPTDTKKFNLYITINADNYSNFDLKTIFADSDQKGTQITEQIQPGNPLIRQISKENSLKKDIYGQDFHFKMDKQWIENDYLEIHIKSEFTGLNLCVQKNKTKYDINKDCDIQGNSHIQRINKSDNQKDEFNGWEQNYVFALIWKVEDDDKEENIQERIFPLDFSIQIQFPQNKINTAILTDGIEHTEHIDSMQEKIYSMQLRKMTQFAFILFSTHSPYIKAFVSTSNSFDEPIVVMTREKFGFKIPQSANFKNEYCEKNCNLFIKVQSTDTLSNQFSLTYTIDNKIIKLKQGVNFNIPNNERFYFFHYNKNSQKILIDFFSENTESILYAIKGHKTNYQKYINQVLSENQRDYESRLGNRGELWIEKNYINDNQHGLYLMIDPKINIMKKTENQIQIYDQHLKMRISLHSQIRELIPYQELEDQLWKEEEQLYWFVVTEPRDFSLFLTIRSGSAQMYLGQAGQIPSPNNFFKKGDSFHDKEIIVTKEDFPIQQNDMVGTYYILVRTHKSSEFGLLFTDHFANMRRAQLQKLVSIKLNKNQYYYVDYFNEQKKFDTYLFSDDSQIDVALMIYDEKLGENMLKQAENEKSVIQKFTIVGGQNPRKKEQLSGDKGVHYLIRFLAKEDCNLDFAFYHKEKPLELPAQQRIMFGLDKSDEQLFSFKLHGEYRKVEFDIDIEHGSILVQLSDDLKNFTLKKEIFKKGSNKIIFEDKQENSQVDNDIVIFKQIFMKVTSLKQSLFSLRANPEDSFKQMKPFQIETIHGDPDKEQYFYFHLDQKTIDKTKNLVIHYDELLFHSLNPEFSFLSDNSIALDSSSPFLPMPLNDKQENTSGELNKIILKPEIKKGIFVIKIPKGFRKISSRLYYQVNDIRMLRSNGVYTNFLSFQKQSHIYKINIPEQGEFRFFIDKCSQINIEEISFIDINGGKKNFEVKNDFAQSYPYLYIDETDSQNIQTQQQYQPIQRGEVDSSGILTIKLSSKEDFEMYQITTEFLPISKKMVLKDYLNIDEQNIVSYSFQDNKLSFKISQPQFKTQFLQDYFFQFLRLELFISLVHTVDVKKSFDQCGLQILEQEFQKNKKQHSIVFKINRQEINQERFYLPEFESHELEAFSNFPFIGVIGMLKISLIDTMEQEIEYQLNQSFADSPYFIIRMKNPVLSGMLLFKKETSKNGILIVFSILVLFLVIYCCWQKKKEKIIIEKEMGYDNPKQVRKPQKLEMV